MSANRIRNAALAFAGAAIVATSLMSSVASAAPASDSQLDAVDHELVVAGLPPIKLPPIKLPL